MNRLVFLLAVLFLFASCKNSSDNIVSKIIDNTNSINSIHYKITEKYYYLNGGDTTTTPYEVWAVRDNSDTLRGGYVWIDNNYRPYKMVYDAGNFYLSIPPKNTTVLYPNFTEELITSVDWVDVFLKPATLQGQVNNSANNTVISDTVYNKKQCAKIVIKQPKNSSGKANTFTYVINKTSLVPEWAMLVSKTDDYTYFSELYFSDYEFDNVDIAVLKEEHKKVLSDNPVGPGGADSEISRLEQMVQIGEKAPLFEGEYLSTGEGFKLSDFIGKGVIVVDFWYTHCPPCVRAIPALSELYLQNKDKGLMIFGLNSVDNQPHSLKNLNKFLSKREISYDIILTAPAVDIAYKINGYPSMYVIDKDGNVAFVEIGYDAEKFKVFKEKIEAMLKE